MSVDSRWLAGEFDGVVLAHEGASPIARAQLFGDLGPKIFDLVRPPGAHRGILFRRPGKGSIASASLDIPAPALQFSASPPLLRGRRGRVFAEVGEGFQKADAEEEERMRAAPTERAVDPFPGLRKVSAMRSGRATRSKILGSQVPEQLRPGDRRGALMRQDDAVELPRQPAAVHAHVNAVSHRVRDVRAGRSRICLRVSGSRRGESGAARPEQAGRGEESSHQAS